MILTTEHILKIISKSSNIDNLTPKEILEASQEILNHIKEIKTSINNLNKLELDENDRHKVQSQVIKDSLSTIRKSCRHYKSTYYPDSSGNNDSSTVCDICGKEVSREERVRFT